MTTRRTVTGEINAAIMNERIRIGDILEAGKHAPVMAARLALTTDTDVETARSLLAATPAANPFLEAMERVGRVNLDAATADFNAPDPKAERLKEIRQSVASFNAGKGYTRPKAAD